MYVGPGIVTDGLVFAVDAGSGRSYDGTTTVNNLAGSNTATLYNGVTYLSINGGVWDFDGTDDYAGLPNSAIPTGNQITMSFWVEVDSIQNSSIIAGSSNGSTQNLNVHLPWGNSTVYFDCGSGAAATSRIQYVPSTAELTGWHNWVFTKNASTGIMKIYLDGTEKSSGSGRTSTIPALTVVNLGRFYTALYYNNGKMANALIYDTALTAAEVTQNYNAQRTRFGL